jgi:hypothetical protein
MTSESDSGLGWRLVKISREIKHMETTVNSRAERDAKTAQRALPPEVRRRQLNAGGQGYVAYSANDLLEWDSESRPSRPGHIHG